MSHHRWFALCLGVTAFMAPGCIFNVEVASSEKFATYDTPGWSTFKLEIENLKNPLVLGGIEEKQIDVVAEVKAWLPTGEDAKLLEGVRLDFVEEDGVVELTTDYDGKYIETFSFKNLTLALWNDAALELAVGQADVIISDMQGLVELTSTSGDIDVTTLGTATLQTGPGDITVNVGEALMETESGEIQGVVEGSCVSQNTSGRTDLTVGGTINVSSSTGPIDIFVPEAGADSITLLGDGGITLSLPFGVGYDVTVAQTLGSITISGPGKEGSVDEETTTQTTGEGESTTTTETTIRRFSGRFNGGGVQINVTSPFGHVRITERES